MPKPPPKYPDVRRCLRPQRHTHVGGEEAAPTAPANVRRNTAEASAHHPDVHSATEVGTSQMRKSLTEARHDADALVAPPLLGWRGGDSRGK